jgi:hypothetical protein
MGRKKRCFAHDFFSFFKSSLDVLIPHTSQRIGMRNDLHSYPKRSVITNARITRTPPIRAEFPEKSVSQDRKYIISRSIVDQTMNSRDIGIQQIKRNPSDLNLPNPCFYFSSRKLNGYQNRFIFSSKIGIIGSLLKSR